MVRPRPRSWRSVSPAMIPIIGSPGTRTRPRATRRSGGARGARPRRRARSSARRSAKAPSSDVRTVSRPSPSSTPRTLSWATSAEASRRSSEVRRVNVWGRSVISRRISRKSPEAASRPPTITSTRSASRSTSSRMCEENTSVRPSAARRRKSSVMCSRCRGSAPLNGSSSSSTSGSWTSAAAILMRCFIPFEYPPVDRCAASSRSTSTNRAARRLDRIGDPLQAAR